MNVKDIRQRYDDGSLLFAEPGEAAERYGDVIVSLGYVKKVWGRVPELLAISYLSAHVYLMQPL